MGPDITFCPAISAQLKPDEHKVNKESVEPKLSDTFWVFELADDGTIIYSRPHIVDTGDGSTDDLEGHNFFDEALGFEDIATCRRHFKSFVDSHKAAQRFVWRCSSTSGTMDTKVLMTRGFQTGYYDPIGVVMMEITAC